MTNSFAANYVDRTASRATNLPTDFYSFTALPNSGPSTG